VPHTRQDPSNVPEIEDWSHLLLGRVAVVTGGGDGIGGAISTLFASHGALVEVAEIDPEKAGRKVEELVGSGGAARAHVVDVTTEDGVNQLASSVIEAHGRIDVLVNNVGDFRPLVPFRKSSIKSWTSMYNTNLLHVIAVTQAFIDAMIEQRRGAIVNVHSVEGMRGYPSDPVYGAMKAAVAHFTTCLAAQVGRYGIRVNGIGPDLTQTTQVDYLAGYEESEHLWEAWAPVGRLGWPEDQARVALFLASDLASFVTGHNIPVDGGTKSGGGWFYSPTERRYVSRPRAL
jgi:NAD(P)-dependent dehydrogenase (short-subunit alcohol dehydrogenase family)